MPFKHHLVIKLERFDGFRKVKLGFMSVDQPNTGGNSAFSEKMLEF